MKLTKSQLKELIKEIVREDEWEEFDLGGEEYGPPGGDFDEIEFSEIVSDAVDQLGGARVLEIVNGVIRTLGV